MKRYAIIWEDMRGKCVDRYLHEMKDCWLCGDCNHDDYYQSPNALCRESLCPLLKGLKVVEEE
jgi:hypothetical protein